MKTIARHFTHSVLFALLGVLALALANPTAGLAGQIDVSFGTGGKVTTSFGANNSDGQGVVVQGDGKIIVAGYAYNGSNDDVALVRYNANGTLDTNFGTSGKVVTPIGTGADRGLSVALQSDGKILVAGYSQISGNDEFAVARYHADISTGTPGTLDTTFGTGGIVTTAVGVNSAFAYGMALQGDGKILVAGKAWNGSNYNFALVRYTTAGVPDATFGTTGIVMTPIGSSWDQAFCVAVQGDGKILVAGSAGLGNLSDFALVRYHADISTGTPGTLDATFGTGGIVTTDFSGFSDQANSVTIQGDGKILLAGQSSTDGSKYDFALARYTTAGALDATFNGTGKVLTAIGTAYDAASSVQVQPDGKIIAAGESALGSNNLFAVARYKADGTPDTTFGAAGKTTTAVGTDSYGTSVALQADGNIVVAGYAKIGTNYEFAVVRYLGKASATSDVNGDGITDLVFQNGAGQVYAWFLDGSGNAVTGSSGLVAGSKYLYTGGLGDWRVVGVADVNGDGIPDLIFQNTAGQIYAWFLDGSGNAVSGTQGLVAGSKYLYTGGLGDWRVVGVADVNGDGIPDIIFQNTAGQIYAWFLDGSGNAVSGTQGLVAGSKYLFTGGLGDWRVMAVADVSGDGIPDIIFQNTTGQVYSWFLDGSGNAVTGSSGLVPGSKYLYSGGLGDWRVR